MKAAIYKVLKRDSKKGLRSVTTVRHWIRRYEPGKSTHGWRKTPVMVFGEREQAEKFRLCQPMAEEIEIWEGNATNVRLPDRLAMLDFRFASPREQARYWKKAVRAERKGYYRWPHGTLWADTFRPRRRVA
jgi:hypothetical protein